MHSIRTIAVACVTGAAGLALFAGATSASAAEPSSLLRGHTTVTIAPSTTRALLSNAILPLPVRPATEYPVFENGFTLAASFPITSGSLDSGLIDHTGGLDFYDFATHKSLVVTDFVINLGAGDITATVPALGVSGVPVFDISLAHATQTTPRPNRVEVNNVDVTLDPVAAGALDSSLETTLFSGGLPIGTASVDVITGR